MARHSHLSLAPLTPPAAVPAVPPLFGPATAAALHAAVLWSDDPAAATPWIDSLAAEGVSLRAVAADAPARGAPPDAALMLLSHGLAPQLSRLRDWRATWSGVPLLVACRSLRDLDHVLALEMGADDVIDALLPAPVVAARLRALWRRCARDAGAPAPAAQTLTFGALELSLAARRVELHARRIDLTEGEFEVLWLLASHAGQTLSRTDILRCVRGLDDHPTDRSIDSRVYRIRAKLGDADATPQRIRTVRHRGYVFSPVGW